MLGHDNDYGPSDGGGPALLLLLTHENRANCVISDRRYTLRYLVIDRRSVMSRKIAIVAAALSLLGFAAAGAAFHPNVRCATSTECF